jgi:hypothetical protein
MKKVQQQPSWLLWGRDITIAAGMLIEYQDMRRVRIARVEQVRVVSVPPYIDTQVIDVKLYGPLTRQDGTRSRTVQPEKVLRVLDAPPPPAPKALASLWSPCDANNPFWVESGLTIEEWRELARWYPFSVRVLVIEGKEARWHEEARTHSWEQARDAMQARASALRQQNWGLSLVVMKCELRGREGREKPVLWYPGPGSVEATLREVGQRKRDL